MGNSQFSFVCSRLSGYATSSVHIKYVTLYSAPFSNAGKIRFFGGISHSRSPEKMVDVKIRPDKTYDICTYTHNDKDMFAWVLTVENRAKFELMMANLVHKYPGRESFTVDLETFTEVTADDFTHFSPSILTEKKGYNAFIFEDATNPEVRFPTIYMIEYKDTEEFRKIFPVMVQTSRWLYPVLDKPSKFGKYLSYMLVHSALLNEFNAICPVLISLDFPTVGKIMDNGIKFDKLDTFAQSCGASNIKVVGGKLTDTNEETPASVPSAEATNAYFGAMDSKTLEDCITLELVNKGCVSFSSMIGFGVPETIKLIGRAERAVEVTMDIGGFAKRMCIFEGFIYAIPEPGQEDNLSQELGEYYVECSAETIPLVLRQPATTIMH